MRITLSMTIAELIQTFENEFDAKISISSKDKKMSTVLFDISKAKDKNVAISISKSTRVRSIEKMFMDSFGIPIQIGNKLGYIAPKDSILATINENMEASIGLNNKIDGLDDSDNSGQYAEIDDDNNAKENIKQNNPATKIEKNIRKLSNTNDEKKEDPRIKSLQEKYLHYQKTEKYADMKILITEIETSMLALNNRKDNDRILLKRVLDETKLNALNVANIYKKKRRFFVFVFAIIALLIFTGGTTVSLLERYNEKLISEDINKIISREDDNGSNVNTELLSEKQKELQRLQNSGIKKDIMLIIGIFFVTITLIFVVKLHKYIVTSTRFNQNI